MLSWAHFGGVVFRISDKIAINEKNIFSFTLLRKKLKELILTAHPGEFFLLKMIKYDFMRGYEAYLFKFYGEVLQFSSGV